MLSFPKVLDGLCYTVCLFSGFSGHQHPYTPTGPISASEAYAKHRRTFYLGWYTDKNGAPQLQRLEKYWLVHTTIEAGKINPSASQPGVYYYRVENAGGRYTVADRIEVEDTADLSEFYSYRTNAAGEVESSYVLTKHVMDRYLYSYAPSGALEDVKVEVFEIP